MKNRHLLQQIRSAIQDSGLNLTLHAQIQMTTRRIAVSDIRQALFSSEAELLEDYSEDPRGPSCLLYGKAGDRVLHIHLSQPPGIVVITAYEPDPARWEAGLKSRKRE